MSIGGAGDFEVDVMHRDGSDVVDMTQDAAGDAQPSWSPDGTKIAFVTNRLGDLEVYEMDLGPMGVTSVQDLTRAVRDDSNPDWQPIA